MNSQRFALRATCVLLSLICSLAFTSVSSAVTVTYIGGDLDVNGSWSTGGRPDIAAEVGEISIGGTQGTQIGWGSNGSTINHTAGIIDFAGFNFNYHTGGTYNLSGGSLKDMAIWLVNGSGMVFNLSGGDANASDMRINAGAALNMLAGDGTVSAVTQANSSGGTMTFETGWTGTFTIDDYDADDWKALFSNTGFNNVLATLNGSSLTSAQFDAAFELTDNDTTVSLIIPTIPEPSTMILAVFGLVGLCFTRRRREVRD